MRVSEEREEEGAMDKLNILYLNLMQQHKPVDSYKCSDVYVMY